MSSFSTMNKVMLLGRLTKDVEARSSSTGTTIAKFCIVTSESVKDQAGNWSDVPTYHNVVAIGNRADNAVKFLRKGYQVFVEGKIQNRSYEDKQGQTRYITEIKADEIRFLEKKQQDGNSSNQGQSSKPPYMPSSDIDDEDDLPF